jgi:hypothetical protein
MRRLKRGGGEGNWTQLLSVNPILFRTKPVVSDSFNSNESRLAIAIELSWPIRGKAVSQAEKERKKQRNNGSCFIKFLRRIALTFPIQSSPGFFLRPSNFHSY